MSDYKQMYYRISGEIADIIEKLEEIQRETEEMYLSSEKQENISDEKFQE